ncbi:MAG: PH domain-containing protein [Mycobacteriales bacterium]
MPARATIAGMGYPRRLLAEDEEVVREFRPHAKVLIVPAVLVVLVAGVTTYGEFAMPAGRFRAAGRAAVLVVAALLLVRYALVPYLRWLSTHFVLTSSRVVIRTGVLRRRGRDIPLSRINDVTFDRTVVERALGCGTLVIESAGERGAVTLRDVPHVMDVQSELYQLAEDDARRD